MPAIAQTAGPAAGPAWSRAAVRPFVVGLIAFLTVVDLFATQAILPSLARAYGVSPSAMGLAVNASTVGMAVAGLAVAYFSRRLDRRGDRPQPRAARGPDGTPGRRTGPRHLRRAAGRAGPVHVRRVHAPLAYLGERCSAVAAAGALAAYVTGNVASNLFGRLLSAAVADRLGLDANFYLFALLNLSGAVLVCAARPRRGRMAPGHPAGSPLAIWGLHLRNAPLRRGFAVGFLILFAFIGTFTFVNFVLVREPWGVSPMALGFVYLVFLPSILPRPTVLRDTALQVEAARRWRMDEDVGAGVGPSERAHHAGGGGSTPEGRRRMSARRKQDAVLRLLRGEDPELLSRQLGVTAADLSGWRGAFLAAGEVSLKTRPADARDAEIGRLKAKVGDLTMANELLEAKVERLETSRPLEPRRSRR